MTSFKASAEPVVMEFAASVGNGNVAMHLFGKRPKGSGVPMIVYFHGGMFNSGAVCDASRLAQLLAAQAVVACVDYPLAPTLRFPDTVELAYDALNWAWRNAASLGADAARMMVAGEQAGGNLAAALAMIARDRAAPNKPVLRAQCLITPMLDPFQTAPSMRSVGGCPCRQGWAAYLPSISDAMHPYASPLNSRRLGGLAQALIVTADGDPLRDETAQYAAKLSTAGVSVQLSRFEGEGHLAHAEHQKLTAMAQTVAQFAASI